MEGKSMSHGELTCQVAQALQVEFGPQRFLVLHDHGEDLPERLGKIRPYFGEGLRSEILAEIDIAVVSRDDKKIYALVEIEETTDKPKVILGDILAILLGEGIAFHGRHELKVGPWTTLIVMVKGAIETHQDRINYLMEESDKIKTHLTSSNKSIRKVVVDIFNDAKPLENQLKGQVCDAISAAYTECNLKTN
jgi:hypothetical protein